MTEAIEGLLRNPETPTGVLHNAFMESDVRSVYAVFGQTGECDDAREWCVCVMLSKEKSEAFCAKMNDWLKSKEAYWRNCHLRCRDRDGLNNPDDPEMHVDYTGTCYTVVEIPLRLEV